jgi:hypothetical protein
LMGTENKEKINIRNMKNYIKFWCDLNIIIRIEYILLKFHWGYESVDRTTFSTLHWKCTLVNTFIPQWNFKRMHSNVIMEARVSSDLSFIGLWNISFIIMWPFHNQSYCYISQQQII